MYKLLLYITTGQNKTHNLHGDRHWF